MARWLAKAHHPMSPEFLYHYQRELSALHQDTAAFALAFPEIAAHLQWRAQDPPDPDLEHLLEGVAFLAARVQTQLAAEQPAFTEQCLALLSPAARVPVPSMLMAQVLPVPAHPGLGKDAVLPVGTLLHTPWGSGRAWFATTAPLTLWPIDLAAAEYRPLPAGGSALRLRLRLHDGFSWPRLGLDRLRWGLGGPLATALAWYRLLTQCLTRVEAQVEGQTVCVWPCHSLSVPPWSDDGPDQPLAPHQLWQNYIAFLPQFLAFESTGLASCCAKLGGTEWDLVYVFNALEADRCGSVPLDEFRLHTVTACNRVVQTTQALPVTPSDGETEWVLDRQNPDAWELQDPIRVTAWHENGQSQVFHPPLQAMAMGPSTPMYSLRREPSTLPSAGRPQRWWLTLCDPLQPPHAPSLRRLQVQAWCSQPGLSRHTLAPQVWCAESPLPWAAVRVWRGPGAELPPVTWGARNWDFLATMGLDLHRWWQEGVDAKPVLQRCLRVWAGAVSPWFERQIEHLVAVTGEPIVCRYPSSAGPYWARGWRMVLTVDEVGFVGASLGVFARVLCACLHQTLPLNTCLETVVLDQRGQAIYRAWSGPPGTAP